MRITILGANSQIAQDLIRALAPQAGIELVLFARRPAELTESLAKALPDKSLKVSDYRQFGGGDDSYDAIINFVGSGNPSHTAAMGAGIFDVTQQFDELALSYLRTHPACRYIFFSSGAAYGSDFSQAVTDSCAARIPINSLQSSDWYGVAKLYAECRHRALTDLAIVDIRVFNYFSHTQDIRTRFLISDILRATLSGDTLKTSTENIVRDYIGPEELHSLVNGILTSPPSNAVVDCYTKAPIDKLTLLAAMQARFGLNYELIQGPTGFTATGDKQNYYSLSKRAAILFGYAPTQTSLETVIEQSRIFLSRQ